MENTRRAQVRTCTQPCFNGLNYQPDNFISTTDVNTLTVQCNHCGSLKFMDETDYLCCANGNVKLDPFPQPQPYFAHLYDGTDSEGRHFLANIQKYNSAFK